MTTENNEQTKDEKVDISAALASIEQKVTEKLSQGMKSIEDKIVSKTSEPADETDDFGGDEDEFVTKKHIPELVTKIAEKVTKATNESLEAKSKKFQRDAEARRDFPEMVPGTPIHNKTFFDEIGKELSLRVERGRSADDTDLIYDCAAAVAARGQREGWYTPKSKVDSDNQRRNNGDDSFSVRGNGRGASGPTEEQVRFASTAGLSKERLTQLLKKTGQIR